MISILLMILGCGTPPLEGACTYHPDCAESEACVEGSCLAVECLSSEQCAFGSTCDAAGHACVAGCDNDHDCGAGEACDDGSCAEASCDDTLEDCGIGESCDLVSGSCATPPGDWCATCDALDPASCGSDALCYNEPWERPQDAFCLPACDPLGVSPCPVGFICAEMDDGNDYCLAHCTDLVAGGYL